MRRLVVFCKLLLIFNCFCAMWMLLSQSDFLLLSFLSLVVSAVLLYRVQILHRIALAELATAMKEFMDEVNNPYSGE